MRFWSHCQDFHVPAVNNNVTTVMKIKCHLVIFEFGLTVI